MPDQGSHAAVEGPPHLLLPQLLPSCYRGLAAAPIGADGKVCYVNSEHTTVQLIADHLITLAGDAVTLATPSGAPDRRVDTR